MRAVFFGLGSDGTVGANKNTIKILGDEEGLHAQGYFVYDSKKSGSQTVSHLRFGPQPISAPYLISQASFVGCHQFGLLERAEVLERAAPGATLLLNCPHPPDQVWDALSRPVQEQILAKRIALYVIDAGQIARDAGLAGRVNTVLQTCFFAISGDPRARAGDRADQGGDREDLRPSRRRGREAQPGGRRPRAGRASPGRASRAGDGGARAAADRPRGRAGVRPHGDRGDDGRPRRRAAGQRAARRRHLSERHDAVREAQHLRPGCRLGRGALHPVRQLQLRLPAQRDPFALLPPIPAGGVAGELQVGSPHRPGSAGHPLHAAGLRRGLHRLRAVRRGMPRLERRRPRAQGDQPRRARAAGGSGAREHRVLRAPADGGPLAGRLRHGARHAVPRAPVRVLRRVRRLRRDPVPEAALAAVRRSADGRQRDRLLVDLRRQPPDHAVDGRPRRARPGVVELAVRGQRRVRARAPSRRRPAHRARPPPPLGAARRVGRGAG